MDSKCLELEKDDEECINQILLQFYSYNCKITCVFSITDGKASIKKNHYVLDADVNRSSIKLSYDEKDTHDVECLVYDFRKLCNIENYKVLIIKEFPLNDEKWHKRESLLIEWGQKEARVNLFHMTPNLLSLKDKDVFMKQMAINSALVCYLNIYDRADHNFVWDEKEKKIFSIDHEKLIHGDKDDTITTNISFILKKFYGTTWYDESSDWRNVFINKFEETWNSIKSNNIDIKKILEKYNQTFNKKDEMRIKLKAKTFYKKIMS